MSADLEHLAVAAVLETVSFHSKTKKVHLLHFYIFYFSPYYVPVFFQSFTIFIRASLTFLSANVVILSVRIEYFFPNYGSTLLSFYIT